MTDVQQAVPVAQEDLELAELIVSRTRGFGVKLLKTDSRAIDIARHRLAAIDATQTREAELREALEFYADRDSDGYRVDVTNYGLSTEEGEIVRDGGARARAALNARGGA